MAKMVWKSEDEIFEDMRESKKQELSQTCHNEIISSFEVNIRGKTYGFSYDMEAQTNMQETYQMFQNSIIDEINWNARKNEDKIRITLNKSEFEKVYYEGIKHKQSLISKLKDELEPLVDSVESKEELEQIKWQTGDTKDINFNIKNTMDKSIENLEISKEMSDMALMEVANMIMMGNL